MKDTCRFVWRILLLCWGVAAIWFLAMLPFLIAAVIAILIIRRS